MTGNVPHSVVSGLVDIPIGTSYSITSCTSNWNGFFSTFFIYEHNEYFHFVICVDAHPADSGRIYNDKFKIQTELI